MQNCIAKATVQLLLIISISLPALSQNILKGKVVDTAENKKLQHSIVALIDLRDTTLYKSWRADANGNFSISQIPSGKYTLMISYPRMADFLKDIDISDTTHLDLGDIAMITEAQLMQEVVVTAGRAIRMRGDTLEYTADSFAVRPGANVEALLKRLPGIEVTRSGQIKSQGQDVQKLLVDGEEFFTDDPKFASQYLKANAVDKVQVYDKKSDEALLTGFDDGKKTKTINLKLKDDAKNGYFGKVATGANGEGNYQHEGMVAMFRNKKKFGVFGLASKSMNRDFSMDVLARAGGEGPEYIEDGTAGMMIVNKTQGEGLGQYSGNGLPSIRNAGGHFSNKWNDGKQDLSGNYRLKSFEGEGWSSSNRYTQIRDSVAFLDRNNSSDNSNGINHSVSSKLGLKLDTFTQMRVNIAGNNGQKNSGRLTQSSSTNFDQVMVNNSEMKEDEETRAKDLKSSIGLYRKMPKLNGNLSLLFEQEFSDTKTDNKLTSTNRFFDPKTGVEDSVELLDRLQAATDNYQSYGGKMSFTGNFSKKWAAQLEYGIKTRIAESRFNTLNNIDGKYSEKVDSLSNNFDLNTLTQIAGAGVSHQTKKYNVSAGAKVFLTGLRQLDKDLDTRRSRNFTNFAPYFRARYSLGTISTMMFDYSGSTIQPSLEQLQPLRRSSNQLNVQLGNPDLVPGFSHRANISFFGGNLKKSLMVSAMIGGSISNNSIINATTVDDQNRRVSKYVNVDGLPSLNINTNISKGWREKGIEIGGGISYSTGGSYSILNGQKFKQTNNNINISTNVRYDLKEYLFAGLRSNFMFMDGKTQFPQAVNTKNFTHSHGMEVSARLPGKIELGTNVQANFNPGNSSFANKVNVITWDAFVEKKFLANEGLVARVAINDILNNNTGYMRTIDGANWSESNGFVLKRYLMFTLSWNFGSSL